MNNRVHVQHCANDVTRVVQASLTDAIVSVAMKSKAAVAAARESTVCIVAEMNTPSVVIGTLVLIYTYNRPTHQRLYTCSQRFVFLRRLYSALQTVIVMTRTQYKMIRKVRLTWTVQILGKKAKTN